MQTCQRSKQEAIAWFFQRAAARCITALLLCSSSTTLLHPSKLFDSRMFAHLAKHLTLLFVARRFAMALSCQVTNAQDKQLLRRRATTFLITKRSRFSEHAARAHVLMAFAEEAQAHLLTALQTLNLASTEDLAASLHPLKAQLVSRFCIFSSTRLTTIRSYCSL